MLSNVILWAYVFLFTHIVIREQHIQIICAQRLCGSAVPVTNTDGLVTWHWHHGFVCTTIGSEPFTDVSLRTSDSVALLTPTSACTHLDARWFLQLSPCCCAKDDDRQPTTCVKCRCPCRQQYQKVWPRSLAATTWWLTLAGRSWPSCVQADSHGSSVSERPCTELSVEPCHPSQRCRVTAAPSVCSTEHTCGPTLQTDHIRPSSIFCCGSHSVEQSSCHIQRPDNQRCLLPTAFKDSSVRTTASAP